MLCGSVKRAAGWPWRVSAPTLESLSELLRQCVEAWR
jgi:hypothetical protein